MALIVPFGRPELVVQLRTEKDEVLQGAFAPAAGVSVDVAGTAEGRLEEDVARTGCVCVRTGSAVRARAATSVATRWMCADIGAEV